MPVGFSLLLATSALSWRKRQSGPSSSFLKAWEADTSLLVLMWLCRMLTILNKRIFSNLMAAVISACRRAWVLSYPSLSTLLETAPGEAVPHHPHAAQVLTYPLFALLRFSHGVFSGNYMFIARNTFSCFCCRDRTLQLAEVPADAQHPDL